MYELVILWQTGEKETHKYETLEEARQIEIDMRIAFGKQIDYSYISRR